MMSNGDPLDIFFYPIVTLRIESYSLTQTYISFVLAAAKIDSRVQGLKSPRTIERKNDLAVICEPADKYHGAGVYMGGQPHFGK